MWGKQAGAVHDPVLSYGYSTEWGKYCQAGGTDALLVLSAVSKLIISSTRARSCKLSHHEN